MYHIFNFFEALRVFQAETWLTVYRLIEFNFHNSRFCFFFFWKNGDFFRKNLEIFKEFSNDANFVATMIDMLNKKYRSK